MDETPPALLTEHGKVLRELVAEYCLTQRKDGLPVFEVHGPFTPLSGPKTEFATKPGCYAIYTATGALKYIGMAKQIGYRSVSHFRRAVQRSSFWQDGSRATYIDLIVAYEPWEPYSLESFLTVRTADLRRKEFW